MKIIKNEEEKKEFLFSKGFKEFVESNREACMSLLYFIRKRFNIAKINKETQNLSSEELTKCLFIKEGYRKFYQVMGLSINAVFDKQFTLDEYLDDLESRRALFIEAEIKEEGLHPEALRVFYREMLCAWNIEAFSGINKEVNAEHFLLVKFGYTECLDFLKEVYLRNS